MNSKKYKIKLTKKAIIALLMICILTPIIYYFSSLIYLLYFSKTPMLVKDNKINDNTSNYNLPSVEESGIENIVLFGVDNRTENDHGRTDSIMIATIDKNSKNIKLTSIMRDLYVKVSGTNSMQRINGSYAYGGPELALKTINENFKLDIKYYAIIDFKAFQDLVDKLGGIDVNIKDNEVDEINKYIVEVNNDNSILLKGPGFQHLNGQQALSFARIRKVGDGDYERTERQRIVIKCIIDKIKVINIIKIPDLITMLSSYVQTNIPLSRIITLGLSAYKFNNGIQTMRIPVDGYFGEQSVYGASVLVPDIDSNALLLREFIYNIKVNSNKDVPLYMKNSFHFDDNLANNSMPKPNIPNYNTPSIPVKPEEDEIIIITPTTTPKPTVTITPTPTTTPKPTGTVTPTPIPKPPGTP